MEEDEPWISWMRTESGFSNPLYREKWRVGKPPSISSSLRPWRAWRESIPDSSSMLIRVIRGPFLIREFSEIPSFFPAALSI